MATTTNTLYIQLAADTPIADGTGGAISDYYVLEGGPTGGVKDSGVGAFIDNDIGIAGEHTIDFVTTTPGWFTFDGTSKFTVSGAPTPAGLTGRKLTV